MEHKEERNVLSKWGNDLRQSYRTLAQAAGVSELDIHLLMNHSLPGVNAGYITRDRLLRDHLRQRQQKISELVVHGLEVKRDLSRSVGHDDEFFPDVHAAGERRQDQRRGEKKVLHAALHLTKYVQLEK